MSKESWISKINSLNTSHSVLERVNEMKATLTSAPNSRGATMLERHLSGARLTRGEAILAKCADCSGHYIDGRVDCGVHTCPLYPFMPYGVLK